MFAKEKKVKRIIDCLPDEVADEVLKKKKIVAVLQGATLKKTC